MKNLKRLLITSTVVLLSFTAVRATDVSSHRRESIDSAKPSLYVLAIGICKYRNYHRRNPAYACKDARDFAMTIERVANQNFEKINMKVLVDHDANEAAIDSAMKDIIINARAEDTFIFFYSGHGEKEGIGANEQFYLVPSDFNRVKNHRLRTHAISASKLQFWFLKVESQHQFIILDSNKSTRGFQEFKNQIDRENQILKPLVQRDVAILSIRSISFEFRSLRNGLLTYLTLQGLNGKAASESGAVTVKNLIDYVNANWLSVLKAQRNRKVQENIRKFPDAGQPDSYFSGDDFALSARANQDRALAVNHHSKLAVSGQRREAEYIPIPQCRASATTRPGTNIANRRGKDFALLIGTNNYKHHPLLNNPIPDAEALAEELNSRFGFETEVLRDVSADCITDALKRYALTRKYPNPDDQLFIFFAGHGTYKEELQEGFLVAKESPRVDPDGRRLYAHALIRKFVEKIPCNHIFLVLDACFSGTIDERVSQREQETTAIRMMDQRELASINGPQVLDITDREESCDFIIRKMQRRTRHLMTSGGKEYVPDGRPGAHSPFTTALLTSLRELSRDRTYVFTTQIYLKMATAVPEPLWASWGTNDPRSEFFFFTGECKNEN
jgi:uncharacterized caspase-like protein